MKKNSKTHIWFVLLELTNKHWFIYQLFSIAMTPVFLWKQITFDMIILAIHLHVTGSLFQLKNRTSLIVNSDTSDFSIPLDIVKWVEDLENMPISHFPDSPVENGLIPLQEDSFWLTVSNLYKNVEEEQDDGEQDGDSVEQDVEGEAQVCQEDVEGEAQNSVVSSEQE